MKDFIVCPPPLSTGGSGPEMETKLLFIDYVQALGAELHETDLQALYEKLMNSIQEKRDSYFNNALTPTDDKIEVGERTLRAFGCF